MVLELFYACLYGHLADKVRTATSPTNLVGSFTASFESSLRGTVWQQKCGGHPLASNQSKFAPLWICTSPDPRINVGLESPRHGEVWHTDQNRDLGSGWSSRS